MRRRSGGTNEANVDHATLRDLDREIAHMEWRASSRRFNNQFRKLAFARLVWLERKREELFAVPAPPRRERRARDG